MRAQQLRFPRAAAGRVSAAAGGGTRARSLRSPRKRFRDGIDATIFAASSEEARGAVLMGTLLEVEGNSLTMVATDGYRLAKLATTLDDGVDGEREIHRPVARAGRSARNLGGGERDRDQRARRAEQPAADDGRRRLDNRAARRRTVSELPAGDSGEVRPHGHREHAAARSAACVAPNSSRAIVRAW